MKKLILLIMLAAASVSHARTRTFVEQVDGNILHTMQGGWVVVDETTSADNEPTVLGEDERKKLRIEAAIAAASSASDGDGEISIFMIPAWWNGARFRSVNITKDSGNVIYQIYLGTLGNGNDCDVVHAGQLDFTSGDQDSMYYQITFTSGGTYIPKKGDVVTGNSSDETAVVRYAPVAATGSFAAATATGTIQYMSSTGAFTNSETIKTGDGSGAKSDVLTHAASDLVLFEYADILALVAYHHIENHKDHKNRDNAQHQKN